MHASGSTSGHGWQFLEASKNKRPLLERDLEVVDSMWRPWHFRLPFARLLNLVENRKEPAQRIVVGLLTPEGRGFVTYGRMALDLDKKPDAEPFLKLVR